MESGRGRQLAERGGGAPGAKNGTSIPLTLSIGRAEEAGTEASLDRLLRADDAAPPAAKREGRNRICLAEGTPAARPAAG